MSPGQFGDRFKNSAMRRVKRDGFVRNVAVALGNSRKSEAIAGLAPALSDKSALVRSHAAWGLGQIPDREAMKVLDSARSKETNPEVLEEIELASKK
jgi:epoxyqueuosine reductase